MSYKYITTNYICDKCHKKYEFSDDKNKPGIRQYRCKHFLLKFIKNKDENELKYFLSIKCLQCSKKQSKINLNITKNYNISENNIDYNNYKCCGNEVNIGAFFSEDENQY